MRMYVPMHILFAISIDLVCCSLVSRAEEKSNHAWLEKVKDKLRNERRRAMSWCEMMEATQSWFRCKNRKDPYCISPLLRCNGKAHCSDDSDEKGCSTEAPAANHRSESTICVGCTDLERRILDLHNELRAKEKAANMNELQWSKKAANKAKYWASQCKDPTFGEHPHGDMDPDYGQNVGRSYMRGGFHESYVFRPIELWYDEKSGYNYKHDKCSSGAKCGHYKTMTTAYAREIGCAYYHCKRNVDGMKTEFWNFVCDYRPWPNWKVWQMHPKQPFLDGKHCSKCQPGLKCRNKLCA